MFPGATLDKITAKFLQISASPSCLYLIYMIQAVILIINRVVSNHFVNTYFIDPDCFPCRWRLNNVLIDLTEKDSHYSVAGGNLVISNPIKTKHEGKYSCLATNTYGTVISQEGSVQFGCKWSSVSDGVIL